MRTSRVKSTLVVNFYHFSSTDVSLLFITFILLTALYLTLCGFIKHIFYIHCVTSQILYDYVIVTLEPRDISSLRRPGLAVFLVIDLNRTQGINYFIIKIQVQAAKRQLTSK